MDEITIIEEADLMYLLRLVGLEDGDIYRLRIAQNSKGQAMVKINEGTWTPPLGERDGQARR